MRRCWRGEKTFKGGWPGTVNVYAQADSQKGRKGGNGKGGEKTTGHFSILVEEI